VWCGWYGVALLWRYYLVGLRGDVGFLGFRRSRCVWGGVLVVGLRINVMTLCFAVGHGEGLCSVLHFSWIVYWRWLMALGSSRRVEWLLPPSSIILLIVLVAFSLGVCSLFLAWSR